MHWLAYHRKHYPLQTPQDIVKIVFQSMLGCGHLLADETTVTARIEAEEATLIPDAVEPLTETMGDYVRLNLRRAMAEGLQPAWIARLMALSCRMGEQYTREEVHGTLLSLAEEQSGFAPEALSSAAEKVLDEQWLPGHSASYHTHYAPAYRVLHASLLPVIKVLCAFAILPRKDRMLIAIDGCCASGKSTMAAQLAEVLAAPVVTLDDFFTPHAEKTPERLAQPGGNADIARFRKEFLDPYVNTGHAVYRPYDCHEDAFGAPVEVKDAPVVIVEGSYSLHPDTGRPYDLQVFLRVAESTQHERILRRNGEAMLQRFISTWIPLEERYFTAFSLPDERCILPLQSQE